MEAGTRISIFALALCALLASCGGSGNDFGPGAPSAPVLSLTPQGIKNFHFAWADVDGEISYRLMEDATGTSGYSEIAQLAANVTSLDLQEFLPARVNARYILRACNAASSCTDSAPVFVSGSLVAAIGYFKAANAEQFDNFGVSVALSADGSTLAVGAAIEAGNATGINGDAANNSALGSGAVYVFVRQGGVWSQQGYIKASNTGTNDQFGSSLALSWDGNTLAVGAFLEDSNATGINGDAANNAAADSGAVYVFVRQAAQWSQQAYIKASNTGANDAFGTSVALAGDGNMLVVGAPAEDSNATGINGDAANNSALESGAAYVFTRVGAVWSQQAYLKASNTGTGDGFGNSVAVSADRTTLAVGAQQEDSNATAINGDAANNTAVDSGAVYVFSQTVQWSQQAYVKAANAGAGDYFGRSLALSADGSTLAVGALFEDSNATGINADATNNAVANSGAAYVFSRQGTAWSQQAYVKASNTGANDSFGRSITLAVDGNTLAVGAPFEGSNALGLNGSGANDLIGGSGAVYVFARQGAAWTQQAYVKAPNTGANDSFGFSVALSSDGYTLAAGSLSEASNATGIGGNAADNSASASGAVYLY